MCGPQGIRFEPSFDFLARHVNNAIMSHTLGANAFDRSRDKEHIHSIEWAFSMLRNGRKVRRKSWPAHHYAFLYRKGASLYGNSLVIDEYDLRKLINEPFLTMMMRADADDESCLPMGDPGDITLHDWALHE